MEKQKFKRRQLVVYPEIQSQVVNHSAILVGLTVLTQAIAFTVLSRFLFQTEQSGGFIDPTTLRRIGVAFVIYEVLATLLIFSLGTYMLNKFTNRVVGPIFNIHRQLKKINEQGYAGVPIGTRQGDFFKDLVHELNIQVLKNVGETAASKPEAKT